MVLIKWYKVSSQDNFNLKRASLEPIILIRSFIFTTAISK